MASVSVEKRDLERGFGDPLPRPAPWWRQGTLVGWADPEACLGRNGTLPTRRAQ